MVANFLQRKIGASLERYDARTPARPVAAARPGADRDRAREGVDDRLALPAETVRLAEQAGIGFARIDLHEPAFSPLALDWLGDHTGALLDDEGVEEARTTTDPGAKWTFYIPTGRSLSIRRMADGDRLWLVLQDSTLDTDHRTIMSGIGGLSTGHFQYVRATGQTRIYGTFLDDRLSPSEQLELRRVGLMSLVHPRDEKRVGRILSASLQGKRDFSTVVECRCRRHDSFMLDVRGHVVVGADGRASKIVGSFRDVTRERCAESDLARLRNEAAAQDSARTLLLARTAHEIRTPMNGVLGMADALLEMPGAEKFAPQLEILRAATRDAIDLLGESMDMSELGIGRFRLAPEAVDVAALVRETAALWTPAANEKDLSLSVRVAGGVPDKIVLDPRRLRQCLNNLLSNAVAFTEEGRIEVVLAAVKAPAKTDGAGAKAAPSAGDAAALPERRLALMVRDTGIGIADEDRDYVFRPFAKGRAGGSDNGPGQSHSQGLGLSITREIAQHMGGNLRYTSTPGDGTSFVMDLPLDIPASDAASTDLLVDELLEKQCGPHTGYEHLRVLAVDDSDTNRLVMENLLINFVGHVGLAEHGAAALERLNEAPYDLILMDIHMPVMDGIEATIAIRSARKVWSDIPIIALTADYEYHNRRIVMNLGMDDAIVKPMSLDGLFSTLDRLGLKKRSAAIAAGRHRS